MHIILLVATNFLVVNNSKELHDQLSERKKERRNLLMNEDKKCPICPKCETEYDSTSKKNDEINVCPNCEKMEALRIYAKHLDLTK